MPGGPDQMAEGPAPTARLERIRQRADAARLRADTIRHRAEEVRLQAVVINDRHSALNAGRVPPASLPPEDARSMGRARVARLRGRAADISEQLADLADSFASYLEEAADRGDRERRLGIAAVEREIAGIERRNAARLRQGGPGVTGLESLPDLPLPDGHTTAQS